MNQAEFIDQLAGSINTSKAEAGRVLDAVKAIITESLVKDEPVVLPGFFTFKVSKRAARKGRNPQTGAIIQISASKVPTGKAGKTLKDEVNK